MSTAAITTPATHRSIPMPAITQDEIRRFAEGSEAPSSLRAKRTSRATTKEVARVAAPEEFDPIAKLIADQILPENYKELTEEARSVERIRATRPGAPFWLYIVDQAQVDPAGTRQMVEHMSAPFPGESSGVPGGPKHPNRTPGEVELDAQVRADFSSELRDFEESASLAEAFFMKETLITRRSFFNNPHSTEIPIAAAMLYAAGKLGDAEMLLSCDDRLSGDLSDIQEFLKTLPFDKRKSDGLTPVERLRLAYELQLQDSPHVVVWEADDEGPTRVETIRRKALVSNPGIAVRIILQPDTRTEDLIQHLRLALRALGTHGIDVDMEAFTAKSSGPTDTELQTAADLVIARMSHESTYPDEGFLGDLLSSYAAVGFISDENIENALEMFNWHRIMQKEIAESWTRRHERIRGLKSKRFQYLADKRERAALSRDEENELDELREELSKLSE